MGRGCKIFGKVQYTFPICVFYGKNLNKKVSNFFQMVFETALIFTEQQIYLTPLLP